MYQCVVDCYIQLVNQCPSLLTCWLLYDCCQSNAYTKPKGLDMHQVHCQMQTSGMVKDACFNIVERMAQLKNLLHLSLAKERG